MAKIRRRKSTTKKRGKKKTSRRTRRKTSKRTKLRLTKREKEIARNLKRTINNYLKLIAMPKDYRDVMKFAGTGIDKILMLRKELDRAQKQYIRMAKKYIRRLTEV